jgi:hypothetical protein
LKYSEFPFNTYLNLSLARNFKKNSLTYIPAFPHPPPHSRIPAFPHSPIPAFPIPAFPHSRIPPFPHSPIPVPYFKAEVTKSLLFPISFWPM